MATDAQVDSIALGLPTEWEEHPLDPDTFEQSLAEQMSQFKTLGLSVIDRRRTELLKRQLRDLLLAHRVLYVATTVALAEPEQIEADAGAENDAEPDGTAASGGGDADGRELVSAAVAVSVTSRQEIGAPVPLDTGTILRSMSTSADEDSRDLDAPSRVDLEAGPAVRLARLHRVPVGDGAIVESIVQTYLVPFDGGERLCSLQCVTPNISVGGLFSSLFDAIANTLRIFREDEKTDFADPSVGRAR